ncbi:hypothetical protein [Budvicia aquatica]|uniref:Uncharacterized protein n=1 Tax=Budvicia aquatica TaxID=82979 RepID=A0A485A140_9GAMM|nr:hypothetical protein [Budvicia aquatica]VFS51229.1 Uncharacterised protein [Budvicia aquatica]
MTEEEQTVLMFKGLIAELSEEQRSIVNAYIDQLDLMLADNSTEATIALGFVGARLQCL